MLKDDKNYFTVKAPFWQYRSYLIWLRLSVLCLIVELGGLAYWGFVVYQKNQKLLAIKHSLLASAEKLDELVRKKNKLLGLAHNSDQKVEHNLGVHGKIANYLTEIENALEPEIQMSSFEYTPKKIELTGYSKNINALLLVLNTLKKLSWVNHCELQQVLAPSKEAAHRLGFTIILEI